MSIETGSLTNGTSCPICGNYVIDWATHQAHCRPAVAVDHGYDPIMHRMEPQVPGREQIAFAVLLKLLEVRGAIAAVREDYKIGSGEELSEMAVGIADALLARLDQPREQGGLA